MQDSQRHTELARRYGAVPRTIDAQLEEHVRGGSVMGVAGAGVGAVIGVVLLGLAAFGVVGWATAIAGALATTAVLAGLGVRADRKDAAGTRANLEQGKLAHLLVVSAQPCLVEEPGSWSPALLVGSVHESFLGRVDHLPALAENVLRAATSASGGEVAPWASFIAAGELGSFGLVHIPETVAGLPGAVVLAANVSSNYRNDRRLPTGEGVATYILDLETRASTQIG